MSDTLKKFRRDLHALAEISREEFQTKEYVLQILAKCPCRIDPLLKTGIVAYFDFQQDHSIAFRAEMDALPIEEKTEADYRSKTKGTMHACGHDGHMAMLLEIAQRLCGMKSCKHNVCLIFQPAEETCSGAEEIMRNNLLDSYSIRHIYALHLNPRIPFGKIAWKQGAIMAAGTEINLIFQGKSAHIAHHHEGADALLCGTACITELMKIPQHDFLCRFGCCQAGTVRNSLAETAVFEGSIRTYHEETKTALLNEITRICTTHCKQTGCAFRLETSVGYPPLFNTQLPFEDSTILNLSKASWMCDDFAYYTQAMKGTYLFLGTGGSYDLHSSHFDFDEAVLEEGVKFYMRCLES